jgi:hypothetical protein
MPRVFSVGGFSVYVYAEIGGKHHLPHCHVRWAGEDAQISLPTLRHLAGSTLPRGARALLRERVDEILKAWSELNPREEVE